MTSVTPLRGVAPAAAADARRAGPPTPSCALEALGEALSLTLAQAAAARPSLGASAASPPGGVSLLGPLPARTEAPGPASWSLAR